LSSEGVNTIVLSKDDLLVSGTYFLKLNVGQKSIVKKVVLVGQ